MAEKKRPARRGPVPSATYGLQMPDGTIRGPIPTTDLRAALMRAFAEFPEVPYIVCRKLPHA